MYSNGQAGPSRPSNLNSLPPSAAPSPRPTPATLVPDDDALDEIRRYESFTTVDWIADSTRERARAARERLAEMSGDQAFAGSSSSSSADAWGKLGYARGERPPRWWPMDSPWGRRAWFLWRLVRKALNAATDSGVVVLVGLLIGANMAVISIATEWASDLKQGYCSAGWWLNQKFCCWEMMDPAGPGGAPIPPAIAKVAAAAAAVTTTLGTASQAANATAGSSFLAAQPGLNTTLAMAGRAASWLATRAEAGASEGLGDVSDTCSDWVPWSSWVFPAWIVYMLFSAALAWTGAFLVRGFAPYAAGSGISEIKCILAGFIINGFLGAWTFAIKSLTLPLAIASGLSVGKEGPAVHVACCIGNLVARCFRSFDRSQARMREVLTAASAAGVAVAFGSPIGGVLFSLEEMAYNFPATTMWRSFLCALAATVTLSFMNPFRTGKLVLFQVSYDRDWHYFEMLFYTIIGVFGGLYGALVIKYNLQVQHFRRNHLAAYGVSEAVTLAVLTAFIGYWNKFLRIDMTESLEILFRECEGGGDYAGLCQSKFQWQMVNSLLLATVLRVALVILSYGCKVPAGIFVPSMAIGATFGRMVGILVKALYNAYPKAAIFSACQPDVPCITPGTYAFLGAAAALAGVTRITVAVVVIMFELTGALTYILPTMFVVMITKGIGDWYGKGGIAEQTIKFQGFPFLDKDDHVFGIAVADVMTRSPVVIPAAGIRLSEVEKLLAGGSYKGFPVVRDIDDGTLLGYIGKTELRFAIAKARRVRGNLSPHAMCRFSLAIEGGDGNGAAPSVLPPLTPYTPATGRFGDDDEDTAESGRPLRSSRRTKLQNEDEENLISEAEAAEEFEVDGHHDDEDGGDGVKSGASSGEEDLELGAWVYQTPLCVQPSMQLEVVMDLFKKMGPRVIIVTRFGKLEGLCTVKDLLKHVAAQEKAHASAMAAAAAASAPSRSGGARGSLSGQGQESYRSHRRGNQSVDAHANGGDFGGELELLLTDAWSWVRDRFTRSGAAGVARGHAGSTRRRGDSQSGGSYAQVSTSASQAMARGFSVGTGFRASEAQSGTARGVGQETSNLLFEDEGAFSTSNDVELRSTHSLSRHSQEQSGGSGSETRSTTTTTTSKTLRNKTNDMSSAEQESFILGDEDES